MSSSYLMPINQKFIDVFQIFMNEEQKDKIRANYVRQYMEGIIDLLLKDEIVRYLKTNEKYDNVNWKRKLQFIKKYDSNIYDKLSYVFKIGGDGSHFNGNVNQCDLKVCIDSATHIVEDIFIHYFCKEQHHFGKENILNIFSMLPLKHRIYIMEGILKHYCNNILIDKLSLAYFKNGEKEKAYSFLFTSLDKDNIDYEFFFNQIKRFNSLEKALKVVQKNNSDFKFSSKIHFTELIDGELVTGYSYSDNVFDTAKVVKIFEDWVLKEKNNYSEFINLFFCLMSLDEGF